MIHAVSRLAVGVRYNLYAVYKAVLEAGRRPDKNSQRGRESGQ